MLTIEPVYSLLLHPERQRSSTAAPTKVFNSGTDLLQHCGGARFATVLADPPWRFQNRTGKMAPEHRRLNRATKR